MPTKKAATTKAAITKMMAAKAPTTTTRKPRAAKAPALMPPSDHEIRIRAYELYLERGGHAGDPLADWLRAESELTSARGGLTPRA